MPSLSDDENARVIGELERVKDFELAKEQIQAIKLKKPGRLRIGFGRVSIVPINGKTLSIQLRHPIAYDRLVQLTQAFSPDLVQK
jgi:hypothetical protein